MPDRPATSLAELARQVRLAPTNRERIAALDRMSPQGRLAAYRCGDWGLDTCCLWASRFPREVPLLNGEFDFIAAKTPEVCEL